MTLNIKTEDWAVLRNGRVYGPLSPCTKGSHSWELNKQVDYRMWTAKGAYYRDDYKSEFDIIATLPCPPFEYILRLEKALRPFAEEAANLGDIEKDDQEYLGVILCGEIRAARRALGESK